MSNTLGDKHCGKTLYVDYEGKPVAARMANRELCNSINRCQRSFMTILVVVVPFVYICDLSIENQSTMCDSNSVYCARITLTYTCPCHHEGTSALLLFRRYEISRLCSRGPVHRRFETSRLCSRGIGAPRTCGFHWRERRSLVRLGISDPDLYESRCNTCRVR